MSDSFKFWMMLLLTVAGIYIGYRILVAILGMILALVVPVAVIGGVVYILYSIFGRKSLPGGRRILP